MQKCEDALQPASVDSGDCVRSILYTQTDTDINSCQAASPCVCAGGEWIVKVSLHRVHSNLGANIHRHLAEMHL